MVCSLHAKSTRVFSCGLLTDGRSMLRRYSICWFKWRVREWRVAPVHCSTIKLLEDEPVRWQPGLRLQ